MFNKQNKMKSEEEKYYALWCLETNRYMATALNAKTKEDVKQQLWEYFSPEREEILLTDDINKVTLELLLEVGVLDLCESNIPFDDEF